MTLNLRTHSFERETRSLGWTTGLRVQRVQSLAGVCPSDPTLHSALPISVNDNTNLPAAEATNLVYNGSRCPLSLKALKSEQQQIPPTPATRSDYFSPLRPPQSRLLGPLTGLLRSFLLALPASRFHLPATVDSAEQPKSFFSKTGCRSSTLQLFS